VSRSCFDRLSTNGFHTLQLLFLGLIDQLHMRKADIAICTERVDQEADLVIETCYEWHHALAATV
jgi:hypothetical protein